MDPNQLQAWIAASTLLVTAGEAAWSDISGWLRSKRPTTTDAELNQILEGVKQDAEARKKLAAADAGGPQG